MIKVMIERQIADELGSLYDQLSRETLQQAMRAHGFISGEVLHNLNDPNHRLILATYMTASDWYRWYDSAERRDLLEQIAPLLKQEEKITLFTH